MANQKAKTYLVAGGAGLIGSFVCERLLREGQNVVCLDNFCTGKKENVGHLAGNKDFTFVKADISSPDGIKELFDYDFDFVLHLASPAGPNPESPKSFHRLWQETYLANSYGTHLLAKLALKNKAVFLFASSSEIYGDPDLKEHPQKEDYFGNVNPVGPRAIYDESKRLGEAITANFNRHEKLQTRIVRIFNTYGPRMNIDDGRALPLFVSQALNNKTITVYGDGRQTRSFCYVDDQVEGILKLLKCFKTKGLPVNIGNPKEITVIQLLEEIRKLVGHLPEIKYSPLPEDDPQRRQPDISRAKELLGWEPKVSLQEGLIKTIEYFKK